MIVVCKEEAFECLKFMIQFCMMNNLKVYIDCSVVSYKNFLMVFICSFKMNLVLQVHIEKKKTFKGCKSQVYKQFSLQWVYCKRKIGLYKL